LERYGRIGGVFVGDDMAMGRFDGNSEILLPKLTSLFVIHTKTTAFVVKKMISASFYIVLWQVLKLFISLDFIIIC
jgi:hypothetical protein